MFGCHPPPPHPQIPPHYSLAEFMTAVPAKVEIFLDGTNEGHNIGMGSNNDE